MKKLIFLFLSLIIFTNINAQSFLFYDDAEASGKPTLVGTNGNIANGWSSRQGTYTGSNPTASIIRTNRFARKGTYSYEHKLWDGPNNNSPYNGWAYLKAELAWNFLPAGSPLGTVGDNTAFYRTPIGLKWHAASIMIPAWNNDFNTITSLLFNTKPVEDDWPTPTYLGMEGGNWIFIVTKLNADGTVQANQPTKTVIAPIVKGQWVDWVMERNYTLSADTGYVRLYMNGSLVHTYLGPNYRKDANHSKEPYIQNGLYKWNFGSSNPEPNVDTVTMYMDEVRFGNYNNVLSDFFVDETPPANIAPDVTVNPTVTTGATNVTIIATSTDVDGTIASRTWTRLSGPNTPSTTGTDGDTLRLSGLISGNYVYKIKVTDNDGASDSANVTIVKQSGRGIIFYDDVEALNKPTLGGSNTDITLNYNARSGVTTNTFIRSTDTARKGSAAYKVVLTNSETVGWQYTDNEMVWNFIPAVTPIGLKWMATSIYVPVSNINDNSPTSVLFNSLRYQDGTYKAHYMAIENNKWVFYHTRYNTNGTVFGVQRNEVGNVDYNIWTDWAIERNYTLSADTAYIRLYKNKQVVFEDNNPNYNSSGTRPEPYVHIGIWKPAYDTAVVVAPNKDSVTFYYDEIAFGDYEITDVDQISPNQSPVIVLNPDAGITNKDTITIIADTYDTDGTIASYDWVKISGPDGYTSVGTFQDTLRVQMSDIGTYVFELVVIDNLGAVSSRRVSFTKEEDFNDLPVITVDMNSIYINNTSVLINIDAYDEQDSTNLIYFWRKENGPDCTITGADTKTPTVSNLKPGTYTFIVTVTDQDGGSSEEPVQFLYRIRGEAIYIPPRRIIQHSGSN